jgi:PAS domain S-box-containing protein
MAGTDRPAEDKVSILLVDDRPDKLLVLEAILAELGQDLVKAQSGKEALKHVLKQDFAVILLDVNMPGMDGFETATLIRQRESSETTPIIFFTAQDDEKYVSRSYSLGAVDYIRTPVDPEILRAKVRVFVDGYKNTARMRRQADERRQSQEDSFQKRLQDVVARPSTEPRLDRFFSLAPDMLGIAGFDGFFKQLNPSWREILGFTEQELLARPILEIVHPEDRAATSAHLERLKEGAPIVSFDNRCVCRDAATRWLGWTASAFPAEGLLYMFVRDITSQKRAEEERVQLVREQLARTSAEGSERRAAFLAEVSNALAASLDYRATLARVARMAVPFLADACIVDIAEEEEGVTRLEVALADPAKHGIAAKLKSAAPGPNSSVPEARALRTGESILIPEVRPADLDGLAETPEHRQAVEALGPRSLMVAPIAARGRTLGALTFIAAETERRFGRSDLGLAEDVARRAALAVENARLYKASQEARQGAEAANRAKDEFLATLSHELRTPLSPILGWTRLLRAGDLDQAATERGLEVIERNVRAQTQLIEDLLDVSRIITGKLRLEVRPMDLAAVVEAGIDAVRPAAEAKGIRIETRLESTGAAMVGDPDRLQQVVWNLVSNAVKFTPKEGRVDVELSRIDSHARLVVRDTGKGIQPVFLPHVFDRLRQADSTSTRAHGGLGIGLAIVRHLVELHGGTVSAESAGEGTGASFTVELPISSMAGTQRTSPDGAAASDEGRVRLDGVRVMVVDDEADTRDLLSFSLRNYGAEVTALGSASEALAAIQQDKPDVLVSDIGLPGDDGYDLIRQVRALDEQRGGRVPAAALTAYAKDEDSHRAIAAGFQAHVTKPVELAELANVVASLAGREPA